MYVTVNPFVVEPRVRVTAYMSFDIKVLRGDRFSTALYT